jgi:hypothetical protein
MTTPSPRSQQIGKSQSSELADISYFLHLYLVKYNEDQLMLLYFLLDLSF